MKNHLGKVYLLLHFRFLHFQELHFQKCHFQISWKMTFRIIGNSVVGTYSYTFDLYTFKNVIFRSSKKWYFRSSWHFWVNLWFLHFQKSHFWKCMGKCPPPSRHFRENFDFYTFKKYIFESVGVDKLHLSFCLFFISCYFIFSLMSMLT